MSKPGGSGLFRGLIYNALLHQLPKAARDQYVDFVKNLGGCQSTGRGQINRAPLRVEFLFIGPEPAEVVEMFTMLINEGTNAIPDPGQLAVLNARKGRGTQ